MGRQTVSSVLEDAEDMLSIFEGALSSCNDRDAIEDDVFKAMKKRSESIRARLRNAIPKQPSVHEREDAFDGYGDYDEENDGE